MICPSGISLPGIFLATMSLTFQRSASEALLASAWLGGFRRSRRIGTILTAVPRPTIVHVPAAVIVLGFWLAAGRQGPGSGSPSPVGRRRLGANAFCDGLP
jgi:hypothetical protein